ncbi:DUF1992 domain-containing protein [Streptomyces sp. NPDC055962]|uniref:DnaJ family domain-containing protein n=1 Tax=Streptomyces sp. NPDC055962 TaxID=3345667 RepID=UPI0035E11F3F
MTERKPAGVSFETWADRQIREAEEQGSFAGLPGAGKPISGLEKPYDAMWWIKAKTEREGLSALPPTLALRKAAEGAGGDVPRRSGLGEHRYSRWRSERSWSASTPAGDSAGVRGKIAGPVPVPATVRLVPVDFLTDEQG